MPLFGKHNKHAADTKHTDAGYNAAQDPNYANQPSVGQQQYNTGAANQGANPTDGQGVPPHHRHQQGYNAGPTGQTGIGGPPHANQPAGVGAGAAGVGAGYGGTNPNSGADPNLPPVSHINTSNEASRSGGGGGRRLEGKAERAVGTLVGSQALKEKGFQKQQEAGAFRMQSTEIAEAERLEKEALLRRERAVAHGAHPDNRHLGGLGGANTLADLSGDGERGTKGAGY